MVGLALTVAAIALPDSINPSLIFADVYLAAGPHPQRRTAAFTAAAFAVTFAGGVLFAAGIAGVELLTRLRAWVLTRWPEIVAPLAAAVGAALVAYGATQLG